MFKFHLDLEMYSIPPMILLLGRKIEIKCLKYVKALCV